MQKPAEKIDPLKKVRLTLEAGGLPGRMDFTEQPLVMEFIFGIGPEGFTPFEHELVDREVGDRFVLTLERRRLPAFMGHIRTPFPLFPEDLKTIYMQIRIERAIPADQREVIRAMADLSSCGDQCCGHDPSP